MAQLRRDYEQFLEKETVVIVVGPEKAARFADYFDKNDLPFRGLPDPQRNVLKLYGQEIKLFKFGRMPAQVLVDKRGVARNIHYGKAMSDIPKNKDILALLDQINREARDPQTA